MQILVGKTAARLDDWEPRELWPAIARGPRPGDRGDAYERIVGKEPPGPPIAGGPHRRAADAILGYRVFPPSTVEGVLRRAPVEVGDTVGIRYHLLPGVTLFFAARVTARFDGVDERGDPDCHLTGFTYRTLVGHPELGEETFSVEKSLATGVVTVALRSWSRPGTTLARLFAPLVRRLQVSASYRALDHLRALATATTTSPRAGSAR